VATITPAQGQTSFIWEHRDDNQASGRTNHTDKTQFSDEDIAFFVVEKSAAKVNFAKQ
jgi:hypothetical protein